MSTSTAHEAPATTGGTRARVSHVVERVLRVYAAACIGWLGLALGLRAAYYGVPELPLPVRALNATLMRWSLKSFLGQMTVPLASAATALVLLLVLAVSRKLIFVREPESRAWRLRAWVVAVVATLLVFNDYVVDADPDVTKLWVWTLGLFCLATLGGAPSRLRRWVVTGVLVLVLFAALDGAASGAIAVSIAVWSAAIAAALFLSGRVIARIDAPLYLLLMTPICSWVLPAGLGLLGHRDDRPVQVETQGYAYGYCEDPTLHKLFMTVPVGETGEIQRLRQGFVAEYDTQTGKRREHHLLTDEFYGGLRMILCLRGAVQVTMNLAKLDGFISASNVLEFDPADPSRIKQSIFDRVQRWKIGYDLLGHAAVYDDERDAVFYVSEWTNTLFRLDRRTGQLDTGLGRILPEKGLAMGKHYGPQTGPWAIHRGRDTIYLSEWADGSVIYEISTTRLEVVRRFDTEDTGAFGLSVDELTDRLYASGLWGINVIDLKDGRVIKRMRTGPGARTAVIDERRQIVYIPSTFGGHIWAIDRGTLEPLGRVLTGLGGRPAYLTRDGRHLYASDQKGVYRWDAEALARRLRKPR